MYIPTIREVSYHDFSKAFDLGGSLFQYEISKNEKNIFKHRHITRSKQRLTGYLAEYGMNMPEKDDNYHRVLDPLADYDLTISNIAVCGYLTAALLYDLKSKHQKSAAEWQRILSHVLTENPGYASVYYDTIAAIYNKEKNIEKDFQQIKEESYYDTYDRHAKEEEG